MREYTEPPAAVIDPGENLTTAVWVHERERPGHPILSFRGPGGQFVDMSCAEMAVRVRRIAAGLMAAGIERGDRVCIFSPTRIEFTLLNYAIWAAGGAVVTIYDTSSAEQVEWIVGDSGARAIVCADAELERTYRERAEGICELVFTLDDGGLDQIVALGAGIPDAAVMERAAAIGRDDLATLIYTSGTTGRPKGCMLSVGNYVFEIRQLLASSTEVLNLEAVTLMFLPLAHSFANLVQACSVAAGARIAFSQGIPSILEELPMVRPTWVFAVPRVFEKIFNGAQQKARAEGKSRIFDVAVRTAIDFSRSGQAAPFRLRLMHALLDRLVYSRLRAVFGGRVRHAISGGAALGERLGHFFNGAGITVLEGYGLTETTAGCTVNRPGAIRIGTVGRPFPGVSIRIAGDGEVLIKGPHVFGGYWNNPQATAEAIDPEGWFHSGDIGELDADGYLRITGRKKELIVTAGGKNVAPLVLEDALRAHPLVSQCMVIGDGRPFVSALVTIDPDELTRWGAALGKHSSAAEHVADPDLIAEVQRAIDDVNRSVSKAEAIRAFRILAQDLSIAGGELTPTLKVKRSVVLERHQSEIESMYGAGS
jgi:long-chain acyl-CoA synthetase